METPSGACDCHTHVFGGHPFAPDRTYTPGVATVEALLAMQARLGLDRVVLVQPSPYGADNACMMAALAALGPRARGVAVIDANTSDATLHALHAAGVRGVRVNLHTAGRADPQHALAALAAAATRVAPLGWHVQTYTDLSVVAALGEALAALPVPVVFDHFARAEGSGGVTQPGLATLLALLRGGRAHVKLSAAHRLSQAADHADMDAIAQAMITANPDRVLWGSDWPHAGPAGDGRAAAALHPFRPIDDAAALARLRRWAGNGAMLRRILVENPARLYDF